MDTPLKRTKDNFPKEIRGAQEFQKHRTGSETLENNLPDHLGFVSHPQLALVLPSSALMSSKEYYKVKETYSLFVCFPSYLKLFWTIILSTPPLSILLYKKMLTWYTIYAASTSLKASYIDMLIFNCLLICSWHWLIINIDITYNSKIYLENSI